MSTFRAVSLAAATLTWSAAAYADHPSIGFSPGSAGPIITIPAATLPAGVTAFGARAEYARSKLLSGEELQSRAGRGIEAHSLDHLFSTSISAAYGVTGDFTLGLRIPYIRRVNLREAERTAGGGANDIVERGDSSGIGDSSVMGKYRFAGRTDSPYEAALLFGIKAPTGATAKRDKQGERFETEHQPASGSWDPLFGFAVTRRIGQASLDASVLYTIATKGAQDTRLGNRASYNLGVSGRLGGEDHHHDDDGTEHHAHNRWDAVLELNGEWEGRQKIGGVADAESGGSVVYLSPGLRFTSANGWSSFLSIGVPVVQHIRLTHPERDYRIIVGAGWAY